MSESLGLYETDRQRAGVTQVRVLSEVERAWLAAAIDGEGSIGFYDYGREGRRVYIPLFNTNEDFVKHAKNIIGCGSSITRRIHMSPEGHRGRKPIFHYGLKGSARCHKLLNQIIPYLIIKKDRAERIVAEINSRPFGRWMNTLPEYRKANSERLKRSWANPTIRQHRLDGMKQWRESRKGGGGQP